MHTFQNYVYFCFVFNLINKLIMKKILLLLVVAVASLTASAQIYVGGDLGFWHNDDADKTVFSIAPSVGYELSESWAIGGELKYSWVKDGDQNMAIAPYARWSFFESGIVRLFADFGFGVAVTKPDTGDSHTGWAIGARPGIALKLNDHFSVLAKCGFAGYMDEYASGKTMGNGFGLDVSGENLSFGIEYTF